MTGRIDSEGDSAPPRQSRIASPDASREDNLHLWTDDLSKIHLLRTVYANEEWSATILDPRHDTQNLEDIRRTLRKEGFVVERITTPEGHAGLHLTKFGDESNLLSVVQKQGLVAGIKHTFKGVGRTIGKALSTAQHFLHYAFTDPAHFVGIMYLIGDVGVILSGADREKMAGKPVGEQLRSLFSHFIPGNDPHEYNKTFAGYGALAQSLIYLFGAKDGAEQMQQNLLSDLRYLGGTDVMQIKEWAGRALPHEQDPLSKLKRATITHAIGTGALAQTGGQICNFLAGYYGVQHFTERMAPHIKERETLLNDPAFWPRAYAEVGQGSPDPLLERSLRQLEQVQQQITAFDEAHQKAATLSPKEQQHRTQLEHIKQRHLNSITPDHRQRGSSLAALGDIQAKIREDEQLIGGFHGDQQTAVISATGWSLVAAGAPEWLTASILMLSSATAIKAGLAQNNMAQWIGWGIYLLGDIGLFFVKHDAYKEAADTILQLIGEKGDSVMRHMPAVFDKENREIMLENLSHFFAEKIKASDPKGKSEEMDTIVNRIRAEIRQHSHQTPNPFDMLVDRTAELAHMFPPDHREGIVERLIDIIGRNTVWVYASRESLQQEVQAQLDRIDRVHPSTRTNMPTLEMTHTAIRAFTEAIPGMDRTSMKRLSDTVPDNRLLGVDRGIVASEVYDLVQTALGRPPHMPAIARTLPQMTPPSLDTAVPPAATLKQAMPSDVSPVTGLR